MANQTRISAIADKLHNRFMQITLLIPPSNCHEQYFLSNIVVAVVSHESQS